MRFYDLQVFSAQTIGQHSIADMAAMAEKLGWTGIAIADSWESMERLNHLKTSIANAKEKTKIELIPAVTLRPKDVQELKSLLGQVRHHVPIVIVAGGDYNVNRAACEDNRVDILVHPEFNRPDSGLDNICMSAAAANGVAIGINFSTILHASHKARARALQHIALNIMMAKNYHAQIIVTSGAQSKWELRDPRQLIAIADILGADLPQAFASASDVPTNIIDRNMKKLSANTEASKNG